MDDGFEEKDLNWAYKYGNIFRFTGDDNIDISRWQYCAWSTLCLDITNAEAYSENPIND